MSTPNNPSEPLVSVCIPTYNRAQKLQLAVNALFNSTYKNLEIIISDNASSDDTENVCRALEKLDRRIKYYRHSENRGPTANFEFARSQATGKYFLWHGDDDYLDINYISECVAELENDQFLVLVSGVAAYHQDGGDVLSYGNIIQANSDWPALRIAKYLWLVTENSIFCGAYRRHVVEQCLMPNCLAGDWIWVSEVLLRGKAKIIQRIHVHRNQGDSTSSSLGRIVSTIGAPSWHGKFPALAISTNVAKYLSRLLPRHGRFYPLTKYIMADILFFFIYIKLKMSRVGARLVPIFKKLRALQ